MATVNQDITSKEYKSAYLLYGSEAYLKNYYKNLLKEALVNPGDNLNYSYFEGTSTNVNEVCDLLQTMPFMAEHRVVIVENSGWFAKSGSDDDGEDGGKASGGKTGQLIESLKVLSEDVIIIFCEEKVDKRSKLYKAVCAVGTAEEYTEQSDEQLARWLANIAKASNKQLDSQTAMYLVSECGKDMLLLQNEMEKLLAWCLERNTITVKDVDEVCTHQVNNKIFDMITAIAVRNQKEALRLYYDLLTLRESPFHILTLMTRQYQRMLAIKDASEKREPVGQTASKLSMQDWLVKKIAEQSKKMSMTELKNCLKACAKADEDIKSGNLSDTLSIELLIVSCSSRNV